jgi:hypothetical protein
VSRRRYSSSTASAVLSIPASAPPSRSPCCEAELAAAPVASRLIGF